MAEAEYPTVGDNFVITIREECLIESHIVDVVEDGVVIAGDDRLFELLEQYGYTTENVMQDHSVDTVEDQAGTDPTTTKKEHDAGYSDAARGINKNPYSPNSPAGNAYQAGQAAYRRHFNETQELNLIRSRAGLSETAPYQPETHADHTDPLAAKSADLAAVGAMQEAEYQGRKVQLGKPFLTPGGPKKRSVYVKNPKGNTVKVNFGDPNMRIKKSNPARRKNFRARHNCANPGPRTSARYWSCRAW